MPEPMSVALVGATVTIVKASYDITVPVVKNTFNKHLNGRSLTKEGGRLMDETIDILSDPNLSEGMVPLKRRRYLEKHERLQPKRQALEKSTGTLTGSVLNSLKAKEFHLNAKSLYDETKARFLVASDSARVRLQLESLSSKAIDVPRSSGAQEEARLAEIHGQTEASETLCEVEIQTQERRPQRTKEQIHKRPSQEFELKIVDAQNRVYLQGQSVSQKRDDPGPATSEAEARLRAILSPGAKHFSN